jgi:hypothetical protein
MKKIVSATLLLWVFSFSVQASTVNFQDTTANAQQTSSFTSGELTFAPTQGYVYTWGVQPGAYNGTTSLIAGFGMGVGGFSFKETNNNAFSLNSLFAGTSWYALGKKGKGEVVFTGHQVGGGILTQTLSLNNTYTKFLFAWTNLLSVDVSANKHYGYVAYDDIDVTQNPIVENTPQAVPIGAAVWLFGSALLGLFGIGRIRQTKMLAA